MHQTRAYDALKLRSLTPSQRKKRQFASKSNANVTEIGYEIREINSPAKIFKVADDIIKKYWIESP